MCFLWHKNEKTGGVFINKNNLVKTAIICLIAATFLNFVPVGALAVNASSTITVGQGGQYSSIQAAINNANAGDIITVYSGTYVENLNIPKQLALKGVDTGSGKPVIDGGFNGGNTVNIRANGVCIDGFVIRNGYHGIDINTAYNTIRNNVITSNVRHGIYITSGGNNLITGNDISNNAVDSVEGETRNAITLYQSNGNVVAGNTMKNNGGTVARDNGAHVYHLGDGVSILESRDTIVRDNVMENDHYAVWVYKSSNNTVTGNIASGMYYCITVEQSTWNNISNNVLSHGGRCIKVISSDHAIYRNNQMSYGIFGFTFDNSNYNVIEDNTWTASTYNGLILSGSSNNVLKGNKEYGNGAGTQITGSNSNTFYLNDFLNGISASGTNYWTSPGAITYQYNGATYTGTVGNRYSDYYGADTNGNGIGETGYNANGVSDAYPLVATHDKYVLPGIATPTPTAQPTATPVPTVQPTVTPSPTVVPTPTAEPTVTPEPTALPTAQPTVVPTPTTGPTVTPKPTATPVSPSPTITPTPSPGVYGVDTVRVMASYRGEYKPIENLSIKAGTTVKQGIYYTNNGTKADSYNVTISGLPSGWYMLKTRSDATLPPGSSWYCTMMLKPMSEGNYTYTVKVTSKSNPDVYDTVTYTMHVKRQNTPGYVRDDLFTRLLLLLYNARVPQF